MSTQGYCLASLVPKTQQYHVNKTTCKINFTPCLILDHNRFFLQRFCFCLCFRFWPRERDSESLLFADVCPVPSTLKVERNPTTGELLGYNEVCIQFVYQTFCPEFTSVKSILCLAKAKDNNFHPFIFLSHPFFMMISLWFFFLPLFYYGIVHCILKKIPWLSFSRKHQSKFFIL